MYPEGLYVLAEPVRDIQPSIHRLYFTCCICGGKDKHNRPVVCQLGGYNYREEGGDLEKEFHCGSAFRSQDINFSRAPENTLLCCKTTEISGPIRNKFICLLIPAGGLRNISLREWLVANFKPLYLFLFFGQLF